MKWKENLYPQQAKSIFEYSMEQAKISADENEWYTKVREKALNSVKSINHFTIFSLPY